MKRQVLIIGVDGSDKFGDHPFRYGHDVMAVMKMKRRFRTYQPR